MVHGELQPGAVVGDYRIERVIGEGSFGKVYAAVHPMIGKQAAVKVLGYEHATNPQFVSRFLEEARAVNKIRHRNIVDIFGFGQLPDGRHYFTMELLEGKAMGDWLKERGAISAREALPILRKVARALEAAHKQGIAHRDLKPDNVFLTFDEDGIVFPKLLDFGIAKLMGDSPMGHRTQTGTPMGTPLYMSPEQCKGANMDHRTDIYSFGILVFEILTGRRPFDSENVMEILMAHMATPPPLLTDVNPKIPAALNHPVRKMLEKDPAARPPSVTIAIEALIAAAKSAGITVPSSRDVRASFDDIPSYGSTEPMDMQPGHGSNIGHRVETVPETPLSAIQDPRHPHAASLVKDTKESPVYTPGAIAAHTNADSSLKPVDAPIPRPPPTQRKSGRGGIIFMFIGLLALVAVVGGGVYVTQFAKDADEETEEDEEEDEVDEDDGGGGKKKKKKKSSPDPAPDPAPAPKAGTFGNKTMTVGEVAKMDEKLRFNFIKIENGRDVPIRISEDKKWSFEVVAGDASGVKKAVVKFTLAENTTTVGQNPTNKKKDQHGSSYEVERQGDSIVVRKSGGSMSEDEQKEVRGDVAWLLGPNLFASTLSGKSVSEGKLLGLPFATSMYLMRDVQKKNYPKMDGSITLQSLSGGKGVFNVAISFQNKLDNGLVLDTDLSGTVDVGASNGRIQALEVYGPLKVSHPKVTFKPGTWSFSSSTAYSR